MDNDSTTDYIAAMCDELAKLARKRGQVTLAYILEMALLEAREPSRSASIAPAHNDKKMQA